MRFWLTILLPYGLGYFISTLLRSINAILATPLSESLHITPADLGWLTSMFMLTFALVQIPLGVLLDTIGPRKSQTLFFLIAALGALLFSLSSTVTTLSIARAILGIGMAGGLMAAIKAIADRVPHDHIPFYNGIVLAAGGLGALTATTPCKLFEIIYGWRALMSTLAGLIALIAVIIFLTSRDTLHKHETLLERIKGVKKIYACSFFWRIVPLTAVALGGFVGMQGLWLGPWLQYVVGLTQLQAANYLLVIAIAMTLGFLSGGLFSLIAKKCNVSLSRVVAIGILVHILTQLMLVWGIFSTHYLMWFIYGYFSQVALVTYAILARHFGPKMSGRAITGANILVFLFAFALQYLFGLAVQLFPTSGYYIAFTTLITLECLALLWFFLFVRAAPETVLEN